MRTKVLLVVAALLMAIVSTVAIGSNMGFKLNRTLTTGTSNFVSLPFYNSYPTASSLWADAGGATEGVIIVKFDKTTSKWINYVGPASTDFNIDPGEAVNVQTSSTHPLIIVGSHNPSLAVTITTGTSNFISVPYHSTSTTASQLWSELGGAAQGIIIVRFNQTTSKWENYVGPASTDFPLVPGEAYNVQTAATFGWTPAHF